MAYDVNADYSEQKAALKKRLDATTDAATRAQIQAQINAADTSRTEKLASDLTKYGKYASDSELDSAAGLMAQNQVGTGYEVQKENLNKSYDNAKQNANNDALSRGMARSTFVSDRLANLDSQRANALSDVDASKALALQNAKANIIDNYRTNTSNALTAEKNEFADNKMTYYNDYQAEINKVLGDNDPTNDWKADRLQGWRNEKLLAQEAAALKAAQKSYTGPSPKPATMTYSQLNAAAAQIQASQSDEAAYNFIMQNAGEYADQLLAIYNLSPPAPTPQRTANYGSSIIQDVNDRINAGYTPQEVMAAAKEKYGVGSKEYNDIVSAVLRQR